MKRLQRPIPVEVIVAREAARANHVGRRTRLTRRRRAEDALEWSIQMSRLENLLNQGPTDAQALSVFAEVDRPESSSSG